MGEGEKGRRGEGEGRYCSLPFSISPLLPFFRRPTMPENPAPSVPKVTAEQRRSAAGQYDRAQEVLSSKNYDYAIELLRKCCLLDPAGMAYRQPLRQAQKDKHGDNQRGIRFAYWKSLPDRLRLQAALGT